ncbi:hypothetical protein [Streptomyces flaveolus]|uniref:hypothetical protein n=1 Tax=Streptomyces flaveolus TaxID=67297 RepID=UPI003401F943
MGGPTDAELAPGTLPTTVYVLAAEERARAMEALPWMTAPSVATSRDSCAASAA